MQFSHSNAADEVMPAPAAAGPIGLLSLRHRDDRGVIRVWGWGSWTPAYVDEHFASLGRYVAETRAAGLPVRVLVNLQKAGHQSPEAIGRIRAGADAIYQPGDRIAMVLESSLIKTQMSQVLDRTKMSFFISETAAALWLTPDLSWERDEGSWRA